MTCSITFCIVIQLGAVGYANELDSGTIVQVQALAEVFYVSFMFLGSTQGSQEFIHTFSFL